MYLSLLLYILAKLLFSIIMCFVLQLEAPIPIALKTEVFDVSSKGIQLPLQS